MVSDLLNIQNFDGVPMDSGWKYYLPDNDETADEARSLSVCELPWNNIYDAEDVAERASEDEWSNRDGYERGTGEGPIIVVISPNGEETRFETLREAEIRHSVFEVEK